MSADQDQANVSVLMETSMGNITVQLNAEKAPSTVANFLEYVNADFYDGTVFHRIIDGFMVQGGGFTADGKQKKTNATIDNEANNGLKNNVGTVAMARTNDPHSATAQFFINVSDNDFLNFSAPNARGWGYTVFGEVTDGMDVVNTIKGVPTAAQDAPVETVLIESISVIE